MSGQIQAGSLCYILDHRKPRLQPLLGSGTQRLEPSLTPRLIGRTKNKCLANPVILYHSSIDIRDFGIVPTRIRAGQPWKEVFNETIND